MSVTENDLILLEILHEFSEELHSTLPLRNFGEFHDAPTLNDCAQKMGKIAIAKFAKKETNLGVIETTIVCTELGERIEEIISKWDLKNQKHRAQSESFLQKRVDVLTEDFNASVERKLSVEPNMEFEELVVFIENRKEKIFGLYDDFFKPGDATFQGEYKTMLKDNLDSLQKEVIDRHSVHWELKLAEKARMLFEEIKTTVLIMFRQLRRKVKSHKGLVPTQLLVERSKLILEYLEEKGHTVALDEHHQVIHQMSEALSGAISFLEQLEKYLTPEKAMEWVERVDQQLSSKRKSGDDDEDEEADTQPQPLSKYCAEDFEVEMQQTSSNEVKTENDEKSVPEIDSRNEDFDPIAPQDVAVNDLGELVELIIKDTVHAGERVKNAEPQQICSNDRHAESRPMASMESESRSEIAVVDFEDNSVSNPPAMDGPHDPLESTTVNCFNQVDPDIETGDDGEPSCSLRIIKIQGSSSDEERCGSSPRPHATQLSSLSGQLSFVCPAIMASTERKEIVRGESTNNTDTDAFGTPSSPPLMKNEDSLGKSSENSSKTARRAKSRNGTPKASSCLPLLRSVKSKECKLPQARNPCSKCNKMCPKHITILTDDCSKYLCDICKKKFKQRSYLKNHGEFCGSIKSKPFICDKCSTGFRTKQNLVAHTQIHTGGKPFQCPQCPDRFSRNESMQRHIRHYTKDSPYICKLCNSTFVSWCGLREHNLNHEGKFPFACSYCDKRFNEVIKLKNHVIIHGGERPFRCPKCESSVATMEKLVYHVKQRHSQLKEAARKIACDASVAYLLKETNDESFRNIISIPEINTAVVNYVIKKENLRLPDACSLGFST